MLSFILQILKPHGQTHHAHRKQKRNEFCDTRLSEALQGINLNLLYLDFLGCTQFLLQMKILLRNCQTFLSL